MTATSFSSSESATNYATGILTNSKYWPESGEYSITNAHELSHQNHNKIYLQDSKLQYLVMRLHPTERCHGWNRPRKGWTNAFHALISIGVILIKVLRIWSTQWCRNLSQVLVKLQTLYTERCMWDYTNTWRKKSVPIFTMGYITYSRIWRHLKSHAFQGICFICTCYSPRLQVLITMDNTHKLFFDRHSHWTQTFSLMRHFTLWH